MILKIEQATSWYFNQGYKYKIDSMNVLWPEEVEPLGDVS